MRSFRIVRKENNYVVFTHVRVRQLEELVGALERHGDLTFEESQKLFSNFTEGGLVKVQSENGQVTLEVE